MSSLDAREDNASTSSFSVSPPVFGAVDDNHGIAVFSKPASIREWMKLACKPPEFL